MFLRRILIAAIENQNCAFFILALHDQTKKYIFSENHLYPATKNLSNLKTRKEIL